MPLVLCRRGFELQRCLPPAVAGAGSRLLLRGGCKELVCWWVLAPVVPVGRCWLLLRTSRNDLRLEPAADFYGPNGPHSGRGGLRCTKSHWPKPRSWPYYVWCPEGALGRATWPQTPLELNRVPLFPFESSTGNRLWPKGGVAYLGVAGSLGSGRQRKSSMRVPWSSDPLLAAP